MDKITIPSKDKNSTIDISLSKNREYYKIYVELGDDGHCDSQISQENFEVRGIDLYELLQQG